MQRAQFDSETRTGSRNLRPPSAAALVQQRRLARWHSDSGAPACPAPRLPRPRPPPLENLAEGAASAPHRSRNAERSLRCRMRSAILWVFRAKGRPALRSLRSRKQRLTEAQGRGDQECHRLTQTRHATQSPEVLTCACIPTKTRTSPLHVGRLTAPAEDFQAARTCCAQTTDHRTLEWERMHRFSDSDREQPRNPYRMAAWAAHIIIQLCCASCRYTICSAA